MNGYATVANPDANEPNKLLVTLPVYTGIIKIENTGQYNVLETDYTTYAMVYSCRELFLGLKFEIGWIMARKKSLDCNFIRSLKMKWKKRGIDTNSFISTDQSCGN